MSKRVNARPIVAAFDHTEVFALECACKAFAAVLDVTDGPHPDPEMRGTANTLRRLATELATANAARSYIESGSTE